MCNNFSYLIKTFSGQSVFIVCLSYFYKEPADRIKAETKFNIKTSLLILRKEEPDFQRGISQNPEPIYWALSYILHVLNSEVFSRAFKKCTHIVEFPIICTE
jgi:hypothetical protein